MNRSTHQKLARRKRRVERRLERARRRRRDSGRPVLTARNVRYDVAGRAAGVGCGGLGAIHLLARATGLVGAIDRELRLLKGHKPYHESDHVMALAYNLLAGGECIEDLESLRTDAGVLDALGAASLPDPTTAGDFCRRFAEADVRALMAAVNGVRQRVWRQQPAASPGFFDLATVDADGTMAPTHGECKAGVGYSYTKEWGYHPLVVSLANTREPLFLVNRAGNRPSHEGAAEYLGRAVDLCRGAGFRRVLLRGDTDFSQTTHLDGWDADGVLFCFGIDAMKNLVARADALPAAAWRPLDRPARYAVKTEPRAKPPRVKEGIVRDAGWKNITTAGEDVAEFAYAPVACGRAYRLVVLRKNLSVLKGQAVLFDDVRYFFFVTNLPAGEYPPGRVVLTANGRCDQENLIQQLKTGVGAMKMPAHDLVSNWAYMVMASLAWTLKAWAGLLLPVNPGHRERHEGQRRDVLAMEFRRFRDALVRVPCQVVRTGRRVVHRILSCTAGDWPGVLVRAARAWRQPLRC